MKETLLFLVKQLVDNPEEVFVDETNDQERTILTIHVNEGDIGKVIGKSGRIIKALRDLVKVLAAKKNTYVEVEIAEAGKSDQSIG